MEGALDAVHAVTSDIAARHPQLPVYMLGHSWGSFLAQRAADRWGADLAGLLLSGSTLLTEEYLSLEDPNARFAGEHSLRLVNHDPDEVQRYLADPWCGFEVAFEVTELLHLAGAAESTVPTDLPVLVLNGSDDAVGGFSGGGATLAQAYRTFGLTDVTFLGYPGGRHELFNERDRDEVIADVVGWLDGRTD